MEDKIFLFLSWTFAFIGFVTVNWLAAVFSIGASTFVMIKHRKDVYNFIKELFSKSKE